MDIRNGLITAYAGISASVGASSGISFYKSTGSYFNLFNNGRLWLGSGTPVDAGYQADINGTTRLNGNVSFGASIVTNTIITGSSANAGSMPFEISNGTNPIFQVVNNGTNGPVSTVRLSQGVVGGPVLIGTNGPNGWGTGGTGSVQIVSGYGSLAGWNVAGSFMVGIGWNSGAVTTSGQDYTIRIGDLSSLQSVGTSSVAIGNSNWGLTIKGDANAQIRLGAIGLLSNVINSTTIGVGLSTSLSNVVLLGLSTQTVMIGAGTSTASGSTIFQVDSTTKGILFTRTSTTASITNPVQGLVTYVTSSSSEGIYYYESGSAPTWKRVLSNIGQQSISGSLAMTGSIFMSPTSSFVLPLTASASPLTGSAYWSGSFLFIWNGSRYMSSSFA